jgi:hypothetical protein
MSDIHALLNDLLAKVQGIELICEKLKAIVACADLYIEAMSANPQDESPGTDLIDQYPNTRRCLRSFSLAAPRRVAQSGAVGQPAAVRAAFGQGQKLLHGWSRGRGSFPFPCTPSPLTGGGKSVRDVPVRSNGQNGS